MAGFRFLDRRLKAEEKPKTSQAAMTILKIGAPMNRTMNGLNAFTFSLQPSTFEPEPLYNLSRLSQLSLTPAKRDRLGPEDQVFKD